MPKFHQYFVIISTSAAFLWLDWLRLVIGSGMRGLADRIRWHPKRQFDFLKFLIGRAVSANLASFKEQPQSKINLALSRKF
jgi:RecB family exonuclease